LETRIGEEMEVPYANLNRIYQESKAELDKAVQDCIDNSWFIKGPKVVEFEKSLSAYCGAPAVELAVARVLYFWRMNA